MVVCPDCGKENAIDSTICDGCGFPLNKLVRCTDCGNECSDEMEICPKCGCPLKDTKQNKKPKIPVRIIAAILVVVIAISSVTFGINKSKKEFQDKLVTGSMWFDAATNNRISFRDNGKLLYASINYNGGLMGALEGGMEYYVATCEYKVKPGNKIVIDGTTVDVSFRVDGKIMFEPDIYPLIKQAAEDKGE